MIKFKKTFTCDVCGEEITYPNFRIEWGYTQLPVPPKHEPYDFIHVCHEDCSYGILNGHDHPITFGDIIFDQLSYTPQMTNERLDKLSEECPLLAQTIQDIKANIFE